MALTEMEGHKLLTDIAEVRSDVKYIREALLEMSVASKDRDKRLSSLETSRAYLKGALATTWAALLWVGWDWVQSLFRN